MANRGRGRGGGRGGYPPRGAPPPQSVAVATAAAPPTRTLFDPDGTLTDSKTGSNARYTRDVGTDFDDAGGATSSAAGGGGKSKKQHKYTKEEVRAYKAERKAQALRDKALASAGAAAAASVLATAAPPSHAHDVAAPTSQPALPDDTTAADDVDDAGVVLGPNGRPLSRKALKHERYKARKAELIAAAQQAREAQALAAQTSAKLLHAPPRILGQQPLQQPHTQHSLQPTVVVPMGIPMPMGLPSPGTVFVASPQFLPPPSDGALYGSPFGPGSTGLLTGAAAPPLSGGAGSGGGGLNTAHALSVGSGLSASSSQSSFQPPAHAFVGATPPHSQPSSQAFGSGGGGGAGGQASAAATQQHTAPQPLSQAASASQVYDGVPVGHSPPQQPPSQQQQQALAAPRPTRHHTYTNATASQPPLMYVATGSSVLPPPPQQQPQPQSQTTLPRNAATPLKPSSTPPLTAGSSTAPGAPSPIASPAPPPVSTLPLASVGLSASAVSAGAAAVAAIKPPVPRAIRLCDSTSSSLPGLEALDSVLQDQLDYTVIGVIGSEGSGKSTLLSAFAAASALSSAGSGSPGATAATDIFPAQSIETMLQCRHQTDGVDAWVTSERVILLDTPPVCSTSVLADTIARATASSSAAAAAGTKAAGGVQPRTGISAATSTWELNQVQQALWLLSVCHVVLVVGDGTPASGTGSGCGVQTSVWRLLRTAEMLRSTLHSSCSPLIRHSSSSPTAPDLGTVSSQPFITTHVVSRASLL